MAWYYKDGDREIGPVSKAELQQLIKSKKVGAKSLLRSVDSDQWRPLAELVRGKPQAKQPQAPPPANEGPATVQYTDKADYRTTPPADSQEGRFQFNQTSDTMPAADGAAEADEPAIGSMDTLNRITCPSISL